MQTNLYKNLLCLKIQSCTFNSKFLFLFLIQFVNALSYMTSIIAPNGTYSALASSIVRRLPIIVSLALSKGISASDAMKPFVRIWHLFWFLTTKILKNYWTVSFLPLNKLLLSLECLNKPKCFSALILLCSYVLLVEVGLMHTNI